MLQQTGRLSLRPFPNEPELATLARAAAAGGDHAALTRLVERDVRVLRSVRALMPGSAAGIPTDVIQSTSLPFIHHGRELQELVAFGGWLATTARR
jgi:hypothetical protein